MDKNEVLAEMLGIEGQRSKVIGFVGELREKKGLAILLSGYAQLVKTISASLLIVGEIRDGEDKSILKNSKVTIRNCKLRLLDMSPTKTYPPIIL